MTCIIGLRHEGVSYVAADTTAHNGARIPTSIDKITEHGKWLIAASGPCRITNLLSERDCDSSNIAAVAWRLKGLMTEAGWKTEDDAGPMDYGSLGFIVANCDAVWYVDRQLSYVKLTESIPFGTGSGSEYGEGAAAALLRWGVPADLALVRAIAVSGTYDPKCGTVAIVKQRGSTEG